MSDLKATDQLKIKYDTLILQKQLIKYSVKFFNLQEKRLDWYTYRMQISFAELKSNKKWAQILHNSIAKWHMKDDNTNYNQNVNNLKSGAKTSRQKVICRIDSGMQLTRAKHDNSNDDN